MRHFTLFSLILHLSLIHAVLRKSRIRKHVNEINPIPYIIGGRNAIDGEAPWQVALQNNLPAFLCGGSILSSRWIATAAQCVNKILVEGLSIRYNTLTLDSGITMHIETVFIHSLFDEKTHQHDIALLKTVHNMTLGQINADAIDLPSLHQLKKGEMINITGWGYYEEHSVKFSQNLQITTLEIVDNDQCNSNLDGLLSDNMFCAKSEQMNVHSAYGDRGGPGTYNGTLSGILITWYDEYITHDGYEIFTKVVDYIFWIISTIQKNE